MKKTLTGSTVAKIAAFFLLAISYLAGCAGTLAAVIIVESQIYTYGEKLDSIVWDAMSSRAAMDYRSIIYGADGYSVLNNPEWVSLYCKGRNLEVKIMTDTDKLVYRTYDKNRENEIEDTFFKYSYIFPAYLETNAESGQSRWLVGDFYSSAFEFQISAGSTGVSQEYFITLYVNPEFPANDAYKELANVVYLLYDLRYAAPIVALVSILVFLVCFIFLMCAAGHHNSVDEGSRKVLPSLLNGIPTDVFTAAYCIVAAMGIAMGVSFCSGAPSTIVVLLIFGLAEIILGTIVCMEFAIRMKLRTFWKNTLIWKILRFLNKCLRLFFRGIKRIGEMMPFVMDTLIVFFAICFFEFLGIMLFGSGELAVLWILEKMVMFPAVVYFAWMCTQLKKGSAALAEGNLQYKMNTSHMILNFREQGENLNRIAQGINTAVEQRMKSEHLKTELITNVSHDLKTPLTSIINYADLIAAESGNSEKVAEYSSVLLRQSKRLKKLLDDLMEASKATTGNLEVTLQPCEIDVLLTQAVGEYEQRFEEKELKLITRQPEEQIRVMADGRHLWRVFDNLLGNICKYALEGSRVYLTVEEKESQVNIIFRNMSKYVLEVSGEELEERFVRGDKSRHMEGNGLGLSIAKSLMDLQGGRMEIITDGDLFKVVLTFSLMQ